MAKDKVTLVYIGPADQDWFNEGRQITLVAGRRYQVESALADYMVEHDTRHWKRPASRETAAVKE